MYPDPEIVRFIEENFVPVRVHVRDDAEEYERLATRYGRVWTPTILVIDPDGQERHRVEGFLPAGDLLAELALGLGHSAFARGDFPEAERWYREVLERHPETEAAPEALYWAGVARYKATGDVAALVDTARQFQQRYQDTSWAKKASVWGGG